MAMEDGAFDLAATPRKLSVVKAEFAHYHQQKRSLALVVVGATCGFLGFLCSSIIGIHKFLFTPTGSNYLGETFRSGNNYRPQTVSEMVHNQDSPEGKAFFAFCLMGSICILASWYPWQLHNVYVGDVDLVFKRCGGPNWPNVRQFLPPLGMLLVVCIPVAPPAQRDFGESFAVAMHCLGAVTMIGGYGMSELYCLLLAPAMRERDVFFKPGEWGQRLALVSLSIFFGVSFQLCGLACERARNWSCADDWRHPTQEELESLSSNEALSFLAVAVAKAMRDRRKLLFDTASGECLWLKAGEFWFEVLAGFFMLCSLWSIWYHALERHIEMPRSLPDVPKDFLRSQGYTEEYVRRGCEVDPARSDVAELYRVEAFGDGADQNRGHEHRRPEGVIPDVEMPQRQPKPSSQPNCWPFF